MIDIVQSGRFKAWLGALRDRAGRARILVRIDRLASGNPGDVKPIGDGISEMRISFGPGYRIYYMQKGRVLAILLAGGDKSSQSVDIAQAKSIAREWEKDFG